MKRTIAAFLTVLFLAAVLAGCTGPAQPTLAPTTPAPTSTLTPTPTLTPDEDPFDIENFFLTLLQEHPGAGVDELCTALLESPYFALFSKRETDPSLSMYGLPVFGWDYKLNGVKKVCCASATSTEDVVIIIEPNANTDAEALAGELAEKAIPDWKYLGADRAPDCLFSKVLNGMVFFALYYSNMRPVFSFAEKGRDYVEMFHTYCAENPDADCAEIASFFATNQKISEMFTKTVTEGQLHGFGVWDASIGWYKAVDINGFADGAMFEPMMEPNELLGYVFHVKDGNDVDAFAAMLRKNANLAYNVCTGLNTIITEVDGSRVLFIMCNE